MNYRLFWIAAAVALFTAGCATQPPVTARNLPENNSPQPVIENLAGNTPALLLSEEEPALDSLAVAELTLADALGLALKHNPTLAGFAAEIRARDAAALQSGLLPNPELGIEVENFAGQDDLEGFDGAETTIAFSQLIELGDKRGKRQQVAVLDKNLAGWDYQGKKVDVLASTARAFIEVLVAQEQVSLNDELVKLAEKTAAAVGERVDAGKVSPMENTRAQVELAAARSEANKAVRELEASRSRLAAFWGAEQTGFARVVGGLAEITPLPPEETIRNLLKANPALARRQSELDRSEAALALARAEAVPDLNISAGVRNFQETDNNALLVGFSVPLPLFDRNQGGIGEARAKVEKARQEQREAQVALRTELFQTWQDLSAAYVESSTLRDKILPGAHEAYESTELGYREGKLDFLQMLDAQRTLFTVKRQYLLALGTYHMTSTDMERLIGASLKSLPKSTLDTSNSRSIQR
jgi:cobalt-zinc-cadmium efflux system outer membrane protein